MKWAYNVQGEFWVGLAKRVMDAFTLNNSQNCPRNLPGFYKQVSLL